MLNYAIEKTDFKDGEDSLVNLTKRTVQAMYLLLKKLEMKKILLQPSSIKSRIPLENTLKTFTPKSWKTKKK